MATGDVYITWNEINANRGEIKLTHYQPDSLTAQQKTNMSAAADGGALVQAANWVEPAATDYFSNVPVIDPATESGDELTSVTWETIGIAVNYEKFRELLTSAEKTNIDSQTGLSGGDIAQCISYLEDLKAYADGSSLCLDRAEVVTILDWFESVGFYNATRTAEIKAGTLPT